MAQLTMHNMAGSAAGEVTLDDAIFNIKVNKDALHQYVVNYLANQRQGTQSALTRTEVRGGGRKPWRQKGTGRARQGSIRSPQWKGGGVVFAPKPRDYRYAINKKLKRLALRSALSDKFQSGNLIIIDNLDLQSFKTKEAVKLLAAFKVSDSLFVTDGVNKNLYISTGNIPKVQTTITTALNTYDILKHEKLILTKAAVESICAIYA